MKKYIIAVFLSFATAAFALPPAPVLIQSNLSVNGYLRLNGTNIEDMATGATLYESVSGASTSVYSGISTVQYDADTGFHLEEPVAGVLRVSLGSAWYYLVAGGTSNHPTGEEDLALAVSSNVTDITWNTNTTPKTLTFPLSAGPRGEPGFSFGVYISSGWSTNITYTTNQWFLYGGDVYGVLATNFTPTLTSPTNYLLSGEVLLLVTSGNDGANGTDGTGLLPYGTWLSSVAYPELAMVRYGAAQYYTTVSSSNNVPGVAANWIPFLYDGSDGAASIVTSNTVWGGAFDYTLAYASNTIVYYSAHPYGGYVTVADYEESVGGLPGVVRLTNTNYFRKIWHYAADGAAGPPGFTPADGVGNMWFRTNGWESGFAFTNAGIIVVHNGETFISTTNSTGVEPGVHASWQSYWVKGAAKGANGGLYRWHAAYDNGAAYTNYDVVINSNTAWLCISAAQVEPPWTTPEKWTALFTPEYVTLASVTTRDYAQYGTYTNGEIVNYGGGAYLCTNSVTNAVGSSPAEEYFYYWIHKGDPGAAGAPGTVTHVYTNMVVSTNVLSTTYSYITNNYTTDLAAVTWSNAMSNSVSLSSNGILDIQFAPGGATGIVAGSEDAYNPTTHVLTWNTSAVAVASGSGFPATNDMNAAGYKLTNAGTITVTNNIHIGPDGITNLARFTVAGNGITNKDPDHYTMTDQQRSSTAAIQGDKSAYFYAEAVNSDVEAVFGVSVTTQGIAGTISTHDFNLRCGNTNKLGVTATGINGHGQTFSNVVLGSGVETDPKWTAGTDAIWQAIGALEASTSGVTAAGATNIAQNVLNASLASADTNSAASKQYVLDNAGTGGGSATKTIGGRATDWAWSGSAHAAPRTTNGVTYLEFPLDTTNLVNGVQLVGVDGISVTQLIIRATASTGGGTIGLLSGFGTALTTNVITIPQFTTNSIQAVAVSHTLTGMTNGLFRWGVLPTNVVGTASGVAWVEIFQARGAW